MATTPTKFPRLKSAGVQGAKVVGREQLTKISVNHKGSSWGNKGKPGELHKDKGSPEAPIPRG